VEAASIHFANTKIPLTEISQSTFPLSKDFSSFLESVRYNVVNGMGFWLGKGLPVRKWGVDKSAVIYMGLGSYLGEFVSQNAKGHLLGRLRFVKRLYMTVFGNVLIENKAMYMILEMMRHRPTKFEYTQLTQNNSSMSMIVIL